MRSLLKNPLTDDDIKVACKDLKVLGKKDFKNLLKWRASLREEMGLTAPKVVITEQSTVEVEPMDEDEQIQTEASISSLRSSASSDREM